ncbi:bacillithiol system redox-active protein YtxJ [Chryseobacterium taihuense]|uniref:Bacillithiol system protein YtxJ n=1 Tax=Chryseobacterium taihuense TaxID=1141221 RepID=A0ABY0QTV7_9FLAO|nr:bacillithiol system redox-active protein YtxJ [Chryseobacterium taihuense]SDL89797.1 bacillithiol system protein YtxJ [Chryseobacterium taihuense]
MSFFDKIFGGNNDNNEEKLHWHIIKSEEDLKTVIQNSHTSRIGIFKHSTSCFISKTVLRNFEKEIKESGNSDIINNLYYLDLLSFRSISNQIAEDLGIRHESPQFLVIENGVVVNHASHNNISLSQFTA